ncbi:hypothetical protein ymoll0001_11730 [Yersinia mollaretii ATCC 43969]|uniref:Uncharacterized protein n=1 Tax=Yersinia mollaretii (strain ATCC 43969 / DSM 18520 / CIP 103324 / CNY 7263 / WAIP 204) TaxID=349967 RepID=A0ABM9YEW7_YERMW|nr:hypothetical protein ymoll0001_11730 [Yersinia mollaretii ATCC 43969]
MPDLDKYTPQDLYHLYPTVNILSSISPHQLSESGENIIGQ